MDFNDGTELMVWRRKEDADKLSYAGLLESMKKEAREEGYEPFDFNYAGNPNIYYRGVFNKETGELVDSGYAMFVKASKSCGQMAI